MIKLDKNTKDLLLDLKVSKRVTLEGNILKLIDSDGDKEFDKYLKECLEKDNATRRKRLEITKHIQTQNNELVQWKEENVRIQEELKSSLEETEKSKEDAENAREEAEKDRAEAIYAKSEADKARFEAENAKKMAENDLDIIQKKNQFELMGTIVKVALWVIIGVGVVTTGVFIMALFSGIDTAVIGSTWSNIIGILLTNAFSIVGTIMGVKYASEKNN